MMRHRQQGVQTIDKTINDTKSRKPYLMYCHQVVMEGRKSDCSGDKMIDEAESAADSCILAIICPSKSTCSMGFVS